MAVLSLSCSITLLYWSFGLLLTRSKRTLADVAVSGTPSRVNFVAERDSPVDVSFIECDWKCNWLWTQEVAHVTPSREGNKVKISNCHPCYPWQNSDFQQALFGELRTTVSYPRSTVTFPNKSWGANTKRPWDGCTVPVRLIDNPCIPLLISHPSLALNLSL